MGEVIEIKSSNDGSAKEFDLNDTTIKMLMRNISQVHITDADGDSGPIADKLSHWDITQIAKAAISALPKEVLVARSACGGEEIAASFSIGDLNRLVSSVNQWVDFNDPAYPIVHRVPLLMTNNLEYGCEHEWEPAPSDSFPRAVSCRVCWQYSTHPEEVD